MSKFNIYAKYGSDVNKERKGVPFYLDDEKTAFIKVARWCNRNVEHTLEQAEVVKQNSHLRKDELEALHIEVFARHLITDWSGVTDKDGKDLEFTVERAVELLRDLPDLADALMQFSLTRENYPLDGTELATKN